MTDATEKCWRCRGDGTYFRLPHGSNPFNMRMPTLVNTMYRVRCCECDGTGRVLAMTTERAHTAGNSK